MDENLDSGDIRMQLLTTVAPMVLSRFAGADVNESHWVADVFGLGTPGTKVDALAKLGTYTGTMNPVLGGIMKTVPLLGDLAEGTTSADLLASDSARNLVGGAAAAAAQKTGRSAEASYFVGKNVAGLFSAIADPAIAGLVSDIQAAVKPIIGDVSPLEAVSAVPRGPSQGEDILLSGILAAVSLAP